MDGELGGLLASRARTTSAGWQEVPRYSLAAEIAKIGGGDTRRATIGGPGRWIGGIIQRLEDA